MNLDFAGNENHGVRGCVLAPPARFVVSGLMAAFAFPC